MHLSFFDADVMIGNTIPPQPSPLLDNQALLDEMDHFGIGQALFFQYTFSPDGPGAMNPLTLAAAKNSKRLVPCWMLETAPVTIHENLKDEAERIVASGAKAARLFPNEGPTAGPFPLRDYLIGGILAGLERYRIPLFLPESLLNVERVGASAYDPVEQICATHPRLPLVIVSPRYNSVPVLMPLMQRHRNLYATITLFGLFHELESLVAMAGPEHFLFGTGLPHLDASIATGMLLYSSLPQKSLELIAAENLHRLLAEAGAKQK